MSSPIIPPARHPLHVDLQDAVHLREALEAALRGDRPAALGAFLSIDAGSLEGIQRRLALLGSSLQAELARIGGGQ